MAVFGDTLKQARAHKGVTLRQAEQDTRINRHYLAALEDENFESLPALIYQKGIVRTYAIYLGLDQAKLVEMFEEARGERPEDPPSINALEPLEMPNHWAPNFAIIAFALVAGAVMFAWLYSAYFNTSEVPATPTELVPTVTPVNQDVIFVPSPTSSIPSPTPTAEPTETPEPTPTEQAELPAPIESENDEAEESGASEVLVGSASTTESSESPRISTGRPDPQSLPDNVAAIMVTALGDLYVQIVVDGVVAYEGSLAPGQTTDWVTGSLFSVYTTSGANTQFTNDRGEVFFMGNESGEIVYELFAE
jgi:cytoskeleton protein RodZ